MNRVSTNPLTCLLLVVATTLRFLFQPAHPFVLPGPKPECFRRTCTEETLGNLDCDGTAGHSDNDHEACSKFCESHSCDSFPQVIDRRQSLAKMAMVAPALWAFPEMACASSSNKQHPSNNTNSKPRDRPIDPELSTAVQKLIDLDKPNWLVPGKDYVINVQGRKIKSKKGETQTDKNDDDDDDAAPGPLFQYVDPAVFENRPTYKSFVALLDNYQPNVCLEEDNTAAETEEAYAFLRACMATPVLRFCYSYCRSKLAEQESSYDVSSKSPKYSFDTEEDFVRILYKIWFQMYSRSGGCDSNNIKDNANISSGSNDDAGEGSRKKVYGSSGFEHVFVGEIRKKKVIGFHNWIQLYRQEMTGNLDYRGTMKTGSRGGGRVLTYNVRWKDSEKPIGTSLIGVSPEFELALYTMVFLVGNQNDNILLLDLSDDNRNAASAPGSAGQGNNYQSLTKLDVKCFRSKGRVGSSYVELVS